MDQHTIPNCYLKAWCDPAPLPEKHTPFIWLISKDGRQKRRRAPENAFTESHRYSIRRDAGHRILTVEQTLGATEDVFVRIRPKVEARDTLTSREKLDLCAFATAMFARSKSQGDHFAEFFRSLHKQVENLERKRGAPPGGGTKAAVSQGEGRVGSQRQGEERHQTGRTSGRPSNG